MIRMIDRDEFTRRWRPIHDRIFSGRAADEKPFASSTWPMALLAGGLSIDTSDLLSIKAATTANGDSKAIICDGEGEWADEPARTFELSQGDLEEIEYNSFLGHTISHIFGESGQWGLVVSHENFSIFSANPATFEVFLEAAGGLDLLRLKFDQASKSIGFGPAGRSYVTALVKMVGWAP
ncbi:MAG: hypothetical protein IPK00_23535 [Deltaproteobacteria bacterium]|nr:hypothetical protein [Deltaproteobacteria bacterium]